MKLLTDHSFHIGEQHLRQGKPCQDYALSGSLSETGVYAIVSDGCSGGGMTDFGARLMTLATLHSIEERVGSGRPAGVALVAARDAYLESYRANLRLAHRDLLATCLFAVVEGAQVYLSVTGDGVAALKYERGLLTFTYTWHDNTPYYPAYRIGGMDDSFLASHQDVAEPLSVTCVLTQEGEQTNISETSPSLRAGTQGVNRTFALSEDGLGALTTIALFSDGVEQIDRVEPSDAINELLAFKSTRGQFATRRMNRFLQESRGLGRGPLDDIAYAVIHLDHT